MDRLNETVTCSTGNIYEKYLQALKKIANFSIFSQFRCQYHKFLTGREQGLVPALAPDNWWNREIRRPLTAALPESYNGLHSLLLKMDGCSYVLSSEVQDFARAIIEDRPPLIDPLDGYHAVQVVEGAYQSIATGKAVAIEE